MLTIALAGVVAGSSDSVPSVHEVRAALELQALLHFRLTIAFEGKIDQYPGDDSGLLAPETDETFQFSRSSDLFRLISFQDGCEQGWYSYDGSCWWFKDLDDQNRALPASATRVPHALLLPTFTPADVTTHFETAPVLDYLERARASLEDARLTVKDDALELSFVHQNGSYRVRFDEDTALPKWLHFSSIDGVPWVKYDVLEYAAAGGIPYPSLVKRTWYKVDRDANTSTEHWIDCFRVLHAEVGPPLTRNDVVPQVGAGHVFTDAAVGETVTYGAMEAVYDRLLFAAVQMSDLDFPILEARWSGDQMQRTALLNSCGTVVAYSVLRCEGRAVPLEEVGRRLGVEGESSVVSLLRVHQCLEQAGISPVPLKRLTPERLRSHRGWFILPLNTGEDIAHFLFGLANGDELIGFDPPHPPRRIDVEKLAATWGGEAIVSSTWDFESGPGRSPLMVTLLIGLLLLGGGYMLSRRLRKTHGAGA